MAGAEKRTGGAGITRDLVLRGLGGGLLGAKLRAQGLEVDGGGGRGLADAYLAPGANSSIFFTMAEMSNWMGSLLSPSLAFAASICSSTKD